MNFTNPPNFPIENSLQLCIIKKLTSLIWKLLQSLALNLFKQNFTKKEKKKLGKINWMSIKTMNFRILLGYYQTPKRYCSGALCHKWYKMIASHYANSQYSTLFQNYSECSAITHKLENYLGKTFETWKLAPESTHQ